MERTRLFRAGTMMTVGAQAHQIQNARLEVITRLQVIVGKRTGHPMKPQFWLAPHAR
jgi:hypothetical protein